ncbi:hypothetical protein ACOME3_004897 [Neoechinorhynchus agilis]
MRVRADILIWVLMNTRVQSCSKNADVDFRVDCGLDQVGVFGRGMYGRAGETWWSSFVGKFARLSLASGSFRVAKSEKIGSMEKGASV